MNIMRLRMEFFKRGGTFLSFRKARRWTSSSKARAAVFHRFDQKIGKFVLVKNARPKDAVNREQRAEGTSCAGVWRYARNDNKRRKTGGETAKVCIIEFPTVQKAILERKCEASSVVMPTKTPIQGRPPTCTSFP